MASQVPQATKVPRAGSVRSKFIVNAILLAAFGLISAPHLTNIPVHEWLSVAFIGLIFVHLILSWNWITGVLRRFLSRLRGTTRFNFVWDVLLYLTMTVAMVSGFLVSEAALPALGFAKSQDRFWHLAHVWSAQAILVVVGVHLAMHFEWVMAAVKRLATRG
ncbi:MAG: DUF4405 domain-containing protein, partial [Gemmatimonadaceae bacterium]